MNELNPKILEAMGLTFSDFAPKQKQQTANADERIAELEAMVEALLEGRTE